MLPESHMTVLERDIRLSGTFATEPYEAGWARQAVFFVLNLAEPSGGSTVPGPGGGRPARAGDRRSQSARIQISADGLHWTDEGSELALPPPGQQAAAKATHFGGWLRLAGELPETATDRFRISLHLKA